MILPDTTLSIMHQYVRAALREGDVAVDATMGNGHDTLFMAQLIGGAGRVYSFDIQSCALENTKRLMEEHGLSERVELIQNGHQHMADYVHCPVAVVMFNLGYLPGGDHSVGTGWSTTIPALASAMELLRPGGLISLAIYYGGDSGFEEKEKVLEYVKTIDYRKFTVLLHDYVNRPNCPPIAVMIGKK